MKVIVIEIFLMLFFVLFLCVDKKIVVVLGESMMSDYILSNAFLCFLLKCRQYLMVSKTSFDHIGQIILVFLLL